MELIMKYIKETNTDIDNRNVVNDLTGEECPKLYPREKKNQLQLHIGCQL